MCLCDYNGLQNNVFFSEAQMSFLLRNMLTYYVGNYRSTFHNGISNWKILNFAVATTLFDFFVFFNSSEIKLSFEI